jgi:hypothetical protein
LSGYVEALVEKDRSRSRQGRWMYTTYRISVPVRYRAVDAQWMNARAREPVFAHAA